MSKERCNQHPERGAIAQAEGGLLMCGECFRYWQAGLPLPERLLNARS